MPEEEGSEEQLSVLAEELLKLAASEGGDAWGSRRLRGMESDQLSSRGGSQPEGWLEGARA